MEKQQPHPQALIREDSERTKTKASKTIISQTLVVEEPPRLDSSTAVTASFSSKEDGLHEPNDQVDEELSLTCENCGTEETPVWRRSTSGATLCNACGLFESRTGERRRMSSARAPRKPRKNVKLRRFNVPFDHSPTTPITTTSLTSSSSSSTVKSSSQRSTSITTTTTSPPSPALSHLASPNHLPTAELPFPMPTSRLEECNVHSSLHIPPQASITTHYVYETEQANFYPQPPEERLYITQAELVDVLKAHATARSNVKKILHSGYVKPQPLIYDARCKLTEYHTSFKRHAL